MSTMTEMLDRLDVEAVEELKRAVADTGAAIADLMLHHLDVQGVYDTGALYNSVRHEEEDEGDIATSYVYADAKSEDGTRYDEFIEYGTGRYNERGNGRQDAWRYKDPHGNWHTTYGQEARPFIRPAVAEAQQRFNEGITKALNLDNYKR